MYKIGNFTIYGEHEDDPGGLSIKLIPYIHHSAYAWWSKTTREVIEAMQDLPIKGASVLDFGCGASAILSLVAIKMGAKKVVACEINSKQAEIARNQIKANSAEIEVVMETEEQFDIIIANIGDNDRVEKLINQSKSGVGTSLEGDLLKW